MIKHTEVMKQALEALEDTVDHTQIGAGPNKKAITALREALALVNEVDQEQPAQRKPWVGLTDEETGHWAADFLDGAKWAEAKLKEKNT